MGRQCCLTHCRNTDDNKPDVSFHRFPCTDTVKYNKWIQAIPPGEITLPLKHNAYICCMHFAKHMLQPTTPTGKTFLTQNAIPSIFYSESEDTRDKNNIETLKRTSVNTSTQVSPKRQRMSETNIQIRRKVHILQQRCKRREQTITTMRNLIDTLRTSNMLSADLKHGQYGRRRSSRDTNY